MGFQEDENTLPRLNGTGWIDQGSIMAQNHSSYFMDFSNGSHSVVPEPPVYILVLATISFVLIFCIGIIGNILVLVVVVCNRNMKTHVNLYLCNLCVADILVLIVCMPTVLIELHTKDAWYFGETMCEFFSLLFW